MQLLSEGTDLAAIILARTYSYSTHVMTAFTLYSIGLRLAITTRQGFAISVILASW